MATSSVSPERLATLPKVELHVHLEGTIDATTAAALARGHGEDPARVLVLERDAYPDPFRDFAHFVACFLATSAQVRTPDDLETVTAAFVAAQVAQQVRWSEATFTAITMVERGWDPDVIWPALLRGLASDDRTAVGFILDTPRDLGVATAARSVDLARRAIAAGLPVVALGLTGIENSRQESDFALLRTAADELGVGLIVHAGETGDAGNVRGALEIGSDRIGHGIAAAEDVDVLARLASEGTVLEVCPSSNVTLGIVSSLEEHPIARLRDAGIAITVNSDDPPFFSTTLTEELAHAVRLLGLDELRLAALQRRAIDASYAPPVVRQQVHAELDAWLLPSGPARR